MFDAVMLSLIAIGLVVAFWSQFWWRLFQTAIVCAVVESDYFWHWAPPQSILAPAAGIFLAAIVTGLWVDFSSGDFKRGWRQRRINSPPPLWLRRLRPSMGLLRRDDGRQ